MLTRRVTSALVRTHLLCGVLFLLGMAVPLPAQQNVLESTQQAFRQVHDKVAPAVVSITTRMEERQNTAAGTPFDWFFGTPGTPSQPRIITASGSGVIIRADGIVLTNSHVVENATKVTVQLVDSDRALPAEVVQADPRTDLAIVRITEKGTYPVVTLGDAGTVKVGDWAIAFGSPFELASTMTVGVISAVGRRVNAPSDEFTYRDMLQTDASINHGNSGGPLVNARGEVVGINSMIYSPGQGGGSVGIGFAIPINSYTKPIINTLASGQRVERGMLGVIVKNLDDAMRRQYGVTAEQGGILVDRVMPGQAAANAGLKDEDVILSFNNDKVTDIDQFIRMVEVTKPGTKAPVVIIRDRKQSTVTVTIGSAAVADIRNTATPEKAGFTVTPITPQLVARYRLPEDSGVLVTKVQPGSEADDAGIEPGDIILKVNGAEIKTDTEFWTAVSKGFAESKLGVVLRLRKGNTITTITLPPSEETAK